MPFRRSLLCPLVILIASCLLTAKTPWFSDDLYLVDVWQTEDGLPQNSATSITQTPDGYLWFGTFNGLVRFDGLRFTVFHPDNTPGLPSAPVFGVHADSGGRLWVATDKGLALLEDGHWTNVPTDWPHGAFVNSFAEDADGVVYLGMRSGRVLRLEDGRFEEFSRIPVARASLAFDNRGILWGATNESFGFFKGRTWTEVEKSEKHSYIGLTASRGGGVLLHDQTGLRKFDNDRWSKRIKRASNDDHRGPVQEDADGNVWGATFSAGLFRYGIDGTVRHYAVGRGLSNESIRAVFEDREGNVWVGTDGGGLLRFKPTVFRSFGLENGLEKSVIKSLAEHPDGGFWVATHGGGLSVLSPETAAARSAAKDAPLWVRSLLTTRDGTTWVGSARDGLVRVRNGSVQRVVLDKDTAITVYALYEDRDGAVWIGTDHGLFQFGDGRLRHWSGAEGLSGLDVRAITEDGSDGLWVGTYDAGLFRFQSGHIQPILADQLGSDRIWSLRHDTDGTLWIGTFGRGLAQLRDGTVVRFDESDGLPARNVTAILDDGNGSLWLGSNRGVIRLKRDELESYASGASSRLRLRQFTTSDGLPTIECSGGSQPNAIRDEQGRLWFATTRGLAVVDPTETPRNVQPPLVHLEELWADQAPHDFKAQFSLPLGARDVELGFGSSMLRSPAEGRIRLRLSGLDERWIDVGDRRTVRYTNLKPGEYRFEAVAANEDGVEGPTAAMEFEVPPFFSEMATVQLSGCALLGLVLFGGYRYRVQRVEKRNHALAAGDFRTETSSGGAEAVSDSDGPSRRRALYRRCAPRRLD